MRRIIIADWQPLGLQPVSFEPLGLDKTWRQVGMDNFVSASASSEAFLKLFGDVFEDVRVESAC